MFFEDHFQLVVVFHFHSVMISRSVLPSQMPKKIYLNVHSLCMSLLPLLTLPSLPRSAHLQSLSDSPRHHPNELECHP